MVAETGGAGTTAEALPLVSLLLLTFNQRDTVVAALEGALRQTYPRLEVVVSDDASTDGSFERLAERLAGHTGPPEVILRRNPLNLGIGGNLNRLVELSHGELLFVAAGDDVSQPTRCARVVEAWLASDRRPDLIATGLVDMDAHGALHAAIVPTDLAGYRDAADWIARPPHVVGAAQAWTRRLYRRFGPLPAGTVAEDRLMVFRAILAGGAITLPEPLVRYRRGGLSARRRAMAATEVSRRLLANSRHALVELPCLLADAAAAGQLDAVEAPLRHELARETFVRDVFAAGGASAYRRAWRTASGVPWAWRLRVLAYAACPWVYAPFFALKRLSARR